tara:strand:+ start:10747 stop:11691 length:945 start_codon:yes stop_codon:yes gene_type:complete
MPKLTRTGHELGSSESAPVVLMKTTYQTNQDVLMKHRDKINKVERIDDFRNSTFLSNPRALRRGTHLEHGVADWAKEELEILNGSSNIYMYEPKEVFQNIPEKMGASIDRIIEISEVPIQIEDSNRDMVTFMGTGIMEIKTDFYHQGKLRPEWLIQVHHQMICSGLTWGIVACLDQKGGLNFYPIDKNDALCSLIVEKVQEFWSLIKTGADYPEIKDKDKPEFVEIEKLLEKSNHDFEQLCSDYTTASSEARKWTKTKDEIKSGIQDILDTLGITHAKFQNFEIISETKLKEKKKMIATGEMQESYTFSLKEKN